MLKEQGCFIFSLTSSYFIPSLSSTRDVGCPLTVQHFTLPFLHPLVRFSARSLTIIKVRCSTEFCLALLARVVPILNNGWFSPFFHLLLHHLPCSSWIFKFYGTCCKKSMLLSPRNFFVCNRKEILIDNADILLELSDLSPSGQEWVS